MAFGRTIPALPVRDTVAAAAFYADRFGFTVAAAEPGFARLVRDDAELHLWQSSDDSWRSRADLAETPVRSGAEDFIAGTASCRIQVDDVDATYAELAPRGVLHPVDAGAPVSPPWPTREFPTLDLDGNLLTFYEFTG